MQFVTTVSDSVLSILYPQGCGTCGRGVEKHSLGNTCGDCWNSTRLFRGGESLCEKCGSFLSDGCASEPTYCGRCETHEYDKARAVGVYEGAVKDTVLGLKSSPFVPFGIKVELIAAFERSGFTEADLVVPVPLSAKRFVERGHNQAAIIASIISRKTGIESDDKALERSIDTPMHRVGMDRKARELTVKKAFHIAHPRLIDGKAITLIDDVFTTGSTAAACAKLLKKHGAEKVFVFTLARAVLY
ncbi:MAG: ComF family protein [Acidobacteriota bacterium]